MASRTGFDEETSPPRSPIIRLYADVRRITSPMGIVVALSMKTLSVGEPFVINVGIKLECCFAGKVLYGRIAGGRGLFSGLRGAYWEGRRLRIT